MAEIDNDFEINKILKSYNVLTDKPEEIVLKNPVLNGMFHGGITRGSMIQIAAQSGVGKSTLVLQIAKELCELGENVLYIDSEKGLTFNTLNTTGVIKFLNNNDTKIGGKLTVVTECDCTRVNNVINTVADKELVSFIIIDSIGTLSSGMYELGGVEANNPKVGGNTRALKIVIESLHRCKITHNINSILINHLAQSIGTYIQTENPTGGRAPYFASDIILKLTKKSSDFEKANLGQKVEFEAIKSRKGLGKCKIPFYIRFGHGIAMIPTYRDVIENIEVTYNGEKHKMLEIRGGGNGSLFVDNNEFKFRGEKQLTDLIIEHYSGIKPYVTPNLFMVEESELAKKIDAEFSDNGTISNANVKDLLPESLKNIKVDSVVANKIYFKKGIDATGQEYYIYLDSKNNRLFTGFDGTEEFTANPTKLVYDKSLKDLQKYLKSAKKDMSK